MSDQAKITLSGVITDIFPAEVYGNFEKRVVWIKETTDQYPQTYAIEFAQGNCNKLDRFKPGEEVKIWIDIRGRRYEKNGKEGVINSLQGWRIDSIAASPTVKATTPHAAPAPAAQDHGDDLPF